MLKKILLALLALVLLVAGTTVYAVASNDARFDSLFPAQIRARREYRRMRSLFPDTIGKYSLYSRGSEKIQMRGETCNRLEDHPDTKGLGLEGEICGKTVIAEYREQEGNHVVFIHALITTKGKDLQNAYLAKVTKPMRLRDVDAFRLERHEIGWYPAKRFDVLLTQEGRWKAHADGSESMSYMEMATGQNPVTGYFLGKFPSKRESM